MLRNRFSIALIALAAACHFTGQAAGETPSGEVRVETTQDGVRFGIWPAIPEKPAPTLFILSGALEESLGQAYYRQSGNRLAERGYLCVSIDLPCHGQEQREGEPAALNGWRYRCEHGSDFVAELTTRLGRVLDHLIAKGWTDPARIAACGTSRGGYSALQFAAADERVKCVAAFAPLTELAAIREFKGAEHLPLVQKLAIHERAGDLAGRGVWLVIGDRDERVGTDHTIRLARRISAESLRQKRDGRVELHVYAEPRGHSTPAGSAERAAEWIQGQLYPAAPPDSKYS
jgi:dienelactone hydrolase